MGHYNPFSWNARNKLTQEKRVARALMAKQPTFIATDGSLMVRDIRTGRPLLISNHTKGE